MPSNFISLESIQIASPCRADWNAMQKVQNADCIRFCPSCGKNVYDISGFTRDEATRLIEAKEGNLCLRLHRRSDGTVITSDCPVGKSASRKRGQLAWLGGVLAGIGALLLSTRDNWLSRHSPPAPRSSPHTLLAKNSNLAPTFIQTEEAIRNMQFEVIVEPTPSSPFPFDPSSQVQQPGVSDSTQVTMGSPPPPPEPNVTPITVPGL